MADMFSNVDEQLKTSLTKNQAPGTNASVVPDALAELVGNSMQQVSDSTSKLRDVVVNEGAVIDKSSMVMNDALTNLTKAKSTPFADIIGIFDPTYDASLQKQTLQTEAMRVQMAQTRIGATKEVVAAEKEVAMAPLQAVTTLLTLQQQMQAGQISNIALNEKLGEMQLGNVMDVGQIKKALKTGDFSALGPNVQPKQARDYLLSLEKASRDAQAAGLAMQANQLQLHDALIASALDNLPFAVAQQAVATAQANKSPYVELAKGVQVPIEKVQAVMATRLKQKQESDTAFSDYVTKLSGLEVTAAATTMGLNRVASATNGTRLPSKPPEAAANQLYGGVNVGNLPLALQTTVARANAESQAVLESVTDPIARATALIDVANKVQVQYDAYVKKEVESAPKEVQPAYEDFYSKGVVTDYAAASNHVTQIMQLPNLFSSNPALKAAWGSSLFNVAKELDKETGSVLVRGEDGKIDAQATQAALFESLGSKKVDAETILRRALSLPGPDGKSTPVDKYVGVHTETLMGQVMGQLAKTVDEATGAVNPIFAGLYDPASGWSAEVATPTQVGGGVVPVFSPAALAVALKTRVEKAQAAGSKITFEEALGTFSNAIQSNVRQYAEQYMLPATPEEASFTVLLDNNSGVNLVWSRMQDVYSQMRQQAAVVEQDRLFKLGNDPVNSKYWLELQGKYGSNWRDHIGE